VVARLKRLLGYPVKILSGIEESQCLQNGVNSFLPHSLLMESPLKQTFLVDLGGGSLEISLLKSVSDKNNNQKNILYSFDIGTLRLRKFKNVTQYLESKLPEEFSELSQVLSANPQDRSHLILTGGNAKTFARLLPQISKKYQSDNSSAKHNKNWLSMDWNEFERIEQIFQKQSAEEQQKRWKLRAQQTEIFNIALAVFRKIGRELRTEKLSIPFFGLKESLLLSLVSENIEKPMQEIRLVLTSGPPKKFKICT